MGAALGERMVREALKTGTSSFGDYQADSNLLRNMPCSGIAKLTVFDCKVNFAKVTGLLVTSRPGS